MIDCHCHLADEQFADDIDEVVDRARRAGVAATLVCSEFSEQFIDKNSVSVLLEDVDSVPAFIEENIDSIAAIGEVAVFRRQIELAITHNLTL
uniref:Uncharacterized protein n=1 Tax=Parascaris equorum TaxID=6256 RepID=A0A914RLW2_PAREQ